jgi:hypothetical protein
MIMDVKYKFPSGLDRDCRQLINSMLVREPEKRTDLNSIHASPWLKGYEVEEEEVLVSGRGLSDKERAGVIQQMIAGGVVSTQQEVDRLESGPCVAY